MDHVPNIFPALLLHETHLRQSHLQLLTGYEAIVVDVENLEGLPQVLVVFVGDGFVQGQEIRVVEIGSGHERLEIFQRRLDSDSVEKGVQLGDADSATVVLVQALEELLEIVCAY